MKLVKSKSGGNLAASLVLSDENGTRSVWDQTFTSEESRDKHIKKQIKYFEGNLKIKVKVS